MLDPITQAVALFAGVLGVPVACILVARARATRAFEASRFVRLRDMGVDPDDVRAGSKLVVLHGPGEGHFRYVRAVDGEIAEIDSPWAVAPNMTSDVIVVDPR